MMTDEPTPATRDTLGSYDAIETAKPDEPLFPIQGGDPFGPATVQFWVDQCRAAGTREEDPRRAEALLRKATDAEMIAWRMAAYQKGIDEDAAAKPSADRDRYSGWEDHADEETRTARAQRAARIKAVSRLHNVLALATEIAEALAQHRVCPEEEVRVREAVDLLKLAALGCEPRRGNERS